jgi:glycosyltransferase involved in cell wall biosynthesis
MRIGLTARWFSLQSGGARAYTEQLIDHLLHTDRDNEYVVFYDSRKHLGRFRLAREVALAAPHRLIWDYVALPVGVQKQQLDLLWIPSYVIPFGIGCPTVTSVLDLAYYYLPAAYRPLDVLYMRLMLPRSVRRAAAILAISENTRRDLVCLFPGAQHKVFVTHLAAASGFSRVTETALLSSVRATYGLTTPFVLYSGSISPRKGLPYLLKAFAKLKRENGIPHCLVLTGGRSWGDAETRRLMAQFPMGEILPLGHVPDSTLPALYTLADLSVYPSLYEGFGLPVLEAMACQCPVVCSNLTSLPEVAGDAAVMVDPRDVSALADAMHQVLSDPVTRKSLVARGSERASMFSWDQTARKTLTVFDRVHRNAEPVGFIT